MQEHLGLDKGTGEMSEGSRVKKDFPVEMTFKLTLKDEGALMGSQSGQGKGTGCGEADTSETAGQDQRPRVTAAEEEETSGGSGGWADKLGAYHEGPCFASKEYIHYPEWDGKLQKTQGPWSGTISSFRWLCGIGTRGQPIS